MTGLRQVVTDAYHHLRQNNLFTSQYDFSRKLLRRSAGYYAFIKSSNSEPGAAAVLALVSQCVKQQQFWHDAAQNTQLHQIARDLFERRAIAAVSLHNLISKIISLNEIT